MDYLPSHVKQHENCDDGLCFPVLCSRCNQKREKPYAGDYLLPSDGYEEKEAEPESRRLRRSEGEGR